MKNEERAYVLLFKGLVSSSAFIYMYICTVLAIWALSPDSSVGG